MRIRRITLQNFLPFGGEHQVAFPDSDDRSLIVFWGRNERGKTTLLNSVRWALYGHAIGRHRKRYKLHQMVNRDSRERGDWSMGVVIEFEDGGSEYVLSRSVDKRDLVSEPQSDGDFIQKLLMTRNGEALPKEQLERVLGRTMPEAISRFHLFDGELLQEYEELVGTETTQVREIRQAIEDILGTPALLLGRDELHGLLKGARKKQADANSKEAASGDAARRMTETQEKIDAANRDLTALDEEIDRSRNEIDEIDEFLEKKAQDLSRKDDIDRLTAELQMLEDRVEDAKAEKSRRLATLWRDLLAPTLAERVSELERSVRTREDRFVELGRLKERQSVQEELRETGECPACGGADQSGPPTEQLTTLAREIQALEESLAGSESGLSRLATLAKVQPTGDRDAILEVESRAASAAIDAQRIRDQIRELRDSVAEDAGLEAQEKRRRAGELQRFLGTLQERQNGVRTRIEELEALEDELSKIMSRSSSAESRKANLTAEVLTELHDLFRRAIDGHRRKLRKEVEREASAKFMSLTGTPAYQGLQINDNYGLSILDHEGRPVDLRSSGAEQVVALSLIQALGALSATNAPLMIDTPFGRLDLDHRRNILREMPKFGGQVVLLAHEGELDPSMARAVAGHSIAAEFIIERQTPTQSTVRRRADDE